MICIYCIEPIVSQTLIQFCTFYLSPPVLDVHCPLSTFLCDVHSFLICSWSALVAVEVLLKRPYFRIPLDTRRCLSLVLQNVALLCSPVGNVSTIYPEIKDQSVNVTKLILKWQMQFRKKWKWPCCQLWEWPKLANSEEKKWKWPCCQCLALRRIRWSQSWIDLQTVHQGSQLLLVGTTMIVKIIVKMDGGQDYGQWLWSG